MIRKYNLCLAGIVILSFSAFNTLNACSYSENYYTSDESNSKNYSKAKTKFEQVQIALSGKNKDLPKAKKLLFELEKDGLVFLNSEKRCLVFIYLGYIEDLNGSRSEAIKWFEKAIDVKGNQLQGLHALANNGLTKSVIWIKHLDRKNEFRPDSNVSYIGKGIITLQPPAISPMFLNSDEERLENFDILWKAIDINYAHFENKGIDWKKTGKVYREKIENIHTNWEFYTLMNQFVKDLKDTHSNLVNYYPEDNVGNYFPGIYTSLINGKLIVIDVINESYALKNNIKTGSEILEINGTSIDSKVNEMRTLLPSFSSERAFLNNAYQEILNGDEGSKIKIKIRETGKNSPVIVDLQRTYLYEPGNSLPVQTKFPVIKDKFIWYGSTSDGYGYIRILSFNGREEISDQFNNALEKLKDTSAMIIDLRGNFGGYGGISHSEIIGRFITEKTKVSINYSKNGPKHNDFEKTDNYYSPSGKWQYTKPVVLLLDTETVSASELFATKFVSSVNPVSIGTNTSGALSGSKIYVVLPCYLVAAISDSYTTDINGNIIETNGVEPKIKVNWTINDLINKKDPFIETAIKEIKKKLEKK